MRLSAQRGQLPTRTKRAILLRITNLLLIDICSQRGEFGLAIQGKEVRVADESSGEYEIVRRGTADELVEHVDGILAAPDERTGQSVGMVPLDRLETADTALWVQLSVSNVRSGEEAHEVESLLTLESNKSLSRTTTGPGWACSGARTHL